MVTNDNTDASTKESKVEDKKLWEMPTGGVDKIPDEPKPDDKIKDGGDLNMVSLIIFKVTKNMNKIEYEGFKAHLKLEYLLEASDNSEYDTTDLEEKLNEYRNKKAFIIK